MLIYKPHVVKGLAVVWIEGEQDRLALGSRDGIRVSARCACAHTAQRNKQTADIRGSRSMGCPIVLARSKFREQRTASPANTDSKHGRDGLSTYVTGSTTPFGSAGRLSRITLWRALSVPFSGAKSDTNCTYKSSERPTSAGHTHTHTRMPIHNELVTG